MSRITTPISTTSISTTNKALIKSDRSERPLIRSVDPLIGSEIPLIRSERPLLGSDEIGEACDEVEE